MTTATNVTPLERTETLEVLGRSRDSVRLRPSWTRFPNDYRLARGVDLAVLDNVTDGKSYNVTMRRESRKTGTDGTKDYHWFWGIVDISEGDDVPAERVYDEEPAALDARPIPRERSIELQVLFKEARAGAEWLLQRNEGTVTPEEYAACVRELFTRFQGAFYQSVGRNSE